MLIVNVLSIQELCTRLTEEISKYALILRSIYLTDLTLNTEIQKREVSV